MIQFPTFDDFAAGYERGEYAMPSYAGALTDSQVESLILFIKTLK